MIQLDPRKGSGELIDLYRSFDIPVTMDQELSDGADMRFVGNGPDGPALVAIERKCISARSNDLLDSMRSRRLSGKQLNDLCEFTFAFIVVEGQFRCGDNGEFVYLSGKDWRVASDGHNAVLYRSVINYLMSIRLKACTCDGWPIIVERTNNPYETVAFTVAMYKWFEKEWVDHHSHDQIYAPYQPSQVSNGHRANIRRRTVTLAEKVAAQLPGFDRGAVQVAGKFKTVEGMVMADESEWRELRLGKNLSKAGEKGSKAYRALREE